MPGLPQFEAGFGDFLKGGWGSKRNKGWLGSGFDPGLKKPARNSIWFSLRSESSGLAWLVRSQFHSTSADFKSAAGVTLNTPGVCGSVALFVYAAWLQADHRPKTSTWAQ